MKRLLVALCLVAFTSPLLKAQPLSKEELTRAVDYLEKTRAGVISAFTVASGYGCFACGVNNRSW